MKIPLIVSLYISSLALRFQQLGKGNTNVIMRDIQTNRKKNAADIKKDIMKKKN